MYSYPGPIGQVSFAESKVKEAKAKNEPTPPKPEFPAFPKTEPKFHDPLKPLNLSPNNDGIKELPPAFSNAKILAACGFQKPGFGQIRACPAYAVVKAWLAAARNQLLALCGSKVKLQSKVINNRNLFHS